MDSSPDLHADDAEQRLAQMHARHVIGRIAFVISAVILGVLSYALLRSIDLSNLSDAGTVAAGFGTVIATAIAAYSIYLERKRADERDDEVAGAWASVRRLRLAVNALDWSQCSSSAPFARALEEVKDSLAAVREGGAGVVFGVIWHSESDRSSAGVTTNAELLRIESLLAAGQKLDSKACLTLICLNNALPYYWDFRNFRAVWETGSLPRRYLREPMTADKSARTSRLLDDASPSGAILAFRDSPMGLEKLLSVARGHEESPQIAACLTLPVLPSRLDRYCLYREAR